MTVLLWMMRSWRSRSWGNSFKFSWRCVLTSVMSSNPLDLLIVFRFYCHQNQLETNKFLSLKSRTFMINMKGLIYYWQSLADCQAALDSDGEGPARKYYRPHGTPSTAEGDVSINPDEPDHHWSWGRLSSSWSSLLTLFCNDPIQYLRSVWDHYLNEQQHEVTTQSPVLNVPVNISSQLRF